MGRRNSNKNQTKISQNQDKQEPRILCSQKRYDINGAVQKILKITSQVDINAKNEWKYHTDVAELLNKIMSIEPGEIHINRNESFDKMIDWIKSEGGLVENVTVKKFENMDYGLQALKDLKEGDLVCSVPQNLMITLENVRNSPLGSLYSKDPILSNMGNIALALFLVLEYLKGVKSFWYPYISVLPEEYHTVLYFTLDDFNELKFSPTYEPALKHCRNIARQYAYFYQIFQKSDDEVSRLLRNNFTYRLYRWAVSTVMTRQNYIPSKDKTSHINALIPLWDMCNHSNGYLTTEFKTEPNRSECFAFRSFKEGEQVLIFYGKRSNSDFLLHNGFVYPENEHDTYHLRLGIAKADPLYDRRVKLLSYLGLQPSGEFYLQSGPEPLDGSLLAFLRIFNMDEGNLNHWLDSNRCDDLRCADCALDTEIECKVWKFLHNRINLLLSGYPKISKIGNEDNSRCRLSVRLLCESEKKLLHSVLDYVQQRLKI